MSNFFGCRIAELRAVTKYGQKKIKLLQNKIDTYKNLIDNLERMNGYNKNSVEARFIRKQYFISLDKLNRWTNSLNNLKDSIYTSMKNFRKDCEHFHEKVEENKQKSIETE